MEKNKRLGNYLVTLFKTIDLKRTMEMIEHIQMN